MRKELCNLVLPAGVVVVPLKFYSLSSLSQNELFKPPAVALLTLRGLGEGGGAVAQSVEHASPAEKVVGSI